LLKGIQLTDINTTKLIKFMHGKMGIKIATGSNLRKQITKVRKSIGVTYEDRVVKNRQEHVIAVRQSSDYYGDALWQSNGE